MPTGTKYYLEYWRETPGDKIVYLSGDTTIYGTVRATVKSFLIDHPTKIGWKLQYASLEGPENGVYIRGSLRTSGVKTTHIALPEYWTELVYPDSITVNLTSKGKFQKIYVSSIENNNVYITTDEEDLEIDIYYIIYAERKDVPKIIVEYQK